MVDRLLAWISARRAKAHVAAGVLFTGFVAFATDPDVRHDVLGQLSRYPKVGAALMTIASWYLIYMKVRKSVQ